MGFFSSIAEVCQGLNIYWGPNCVAIRILANIIYVVNFLYYKPIMNTNRYPLETKKRFQLYFAVPQIMQ